MSLYAGWTQFADDFAVLSKHLRDFAAARVSIRSASDFTLEDECKLEGLLSRVWQTWAGFCRLCICESCLGTTNGLGVIVPRHAHALSEAHVSSAAIRAKSPTTRVIWGSTNTLLRLEPTWGDVDVLNRIIPRLNPANQGQLLAAFSAGSQSAKALQFIRNASAHNNIQTMADVHGIRSRYIVFPVTHPVQALYWTDPATRDFLVLHAIEELLDTGLNAIS